MSSDTPRPDDHLDPDALAFARGALTRRDLLRRAGLAGGMLAGGSLLAACGGGSVGGAGSASAPPSSGVKYARQVASTWTFSNWPLYIDVEKGRHPSLDLFDKKYHTKTKYIEEINDNLEFFGKVQADLQADNSLDRDIVVLTDWMAAKWIRLGYAMPLEKDLLPNVEANQVPTLRHRSVDPTDSYLVPWQSGLTGLGYDPKLTGFALKSVFDIFDPRLKGKVALLTEMRDTFGLVMLGLGIDPVNATVADAQKAKDKIQPYVDNNQIRAFVGNNYQQGLATGDIAAAFAWSGDIVQLQADNPSLKFVVPKEGCMIWTDNMLIPQKAPHPYNAHLWMNFYYQPKIAAMVEDWVNYICPVKGAGDVLKAQDPSIAKNPLIFPPQSTLDQAHVFKALSPEDEQKMNTLFEQLQGA
jgi:spermidine/putrescine transport system substrate-binding protein